MLTSISRCHKKQYVSKNEAPVLKYHTSLLCTSSLLTWLQLCRNQKSYGASCPSKNAKGSNMRLSVKTYIQYVVLQSYSLIFLNGLFRYVKKIQLSWVGGRAGGTFIPISIVNMELNRNSLLKTESSLFWKKSGQNISAAPGMYFTTHAANSSECSILWDWLFRLLMISIQQPVCASKMNEWREMASESSITWYQVVNSSHQTLFSSPLDTSLHWWPTKWT